MKVFKIWCEWDIGINEDIFISYDVAVKHIEKAIANCGLIDDNPEDYTVEALLDEGLLGIEKVWVVEE